MLIGFYVIIAAAVVTMLFALGLAFRLRRVARGGKVGRVVNLLTVFIALFLTSYLCGPIFPRLSAAAVSLFTALVFLAGAVFVVIVLRVLDSLVRQVFDELKL